MNEWPPTWARAELGALIRKIEAGLNVKCEERPPEAGERGLVKISAVTWGRFDEQQSKTLPLDVAVDERNRIRSGDLLISRANTIELVGASVIVGAVARTLYLSDKVLRLDVEEHLKRWVNYALKTPWMRKAIEAASSGNQLSMRNLSQDKLRRLPIPLPSMEEQQRIADKLDIVLARVDACRDRLDRVAPLLKRFRQSVLAAATSGWLTEDWRLDHCSVETGAVLLAALQRDHALAGGHARGNASEPTEEAHDLERSILPSTWAVARMIDVCEPGRPITYGILKPGPELEDGVPYVRVADFPGNQLRLDSIRKTSSQIDEQFKRARLRAGDLLLSIRGSVGRVIEIPEALANANITQDTARLSVSIRTNRRYVLLALLDEGTQRRMRAATRGVAVRGINIGDVRALQIPLPPVEEQAEIVRRVESLFAVADRLEARLAQAQTAVDRLTPSLLAKAFRGELVPQDPADEPASALLEKLKMAQTNAAAEASPRAPKTSGKRTIMSTTDKDSIKAAILELKTDRFSFDELRAQVSGDYESLKSALFELLQEPHPVVRQVFDKKVKAIQLERVSS